MFMVLHGHFHLVIIMSVINKNSKSYLRNVVILCEQGDSACKMSCFIIATYKDFLLEDPLIPSWSDSGKVGQLRKD